jgi:hypothetical protein
MCEYWRECTTFRLSALHHERSYPRGRFFLSFPFYIFASAVRLACTSYGFRHPLVGVPLLRSRGRSLMKPVGRGSSWWRLQQEDPQNPISALAVAGGVDGALRQRA